MVVMGLELGGGRMDGEEEKGGRGGLYVEGEGEVANGR
jgi:hypothetical protein